MKKLLLAVVLVLSGANMIKAQELRYGVRGGVNLAKTHAKSDYAENTTDALTSFYVGGLVELPLTNFNDKLSGQIELLYAQNGGKVNGPYTDEEVKVKVGEIMMPVFLKYNIYQGLSLSAGTYLGAIISAKTEYEEGDSYDDKDDFKTLDAGLLFGTEYNFPNGLFVDLRYNLGLLNILDDEDGIEGHNRTFNLGVGYKF